MKYLNAEQEVRIARRRMRRCKMGEEGEVEDEVKCPNHLPVPVYKPTASTF
jgi:hypothetical protein